MKNIYRLILISAVFTVITAALSAQPAPEYTTTEELQQLIDRETKEYLLIDVRTEEEYNSGHIPTAIHIPYTEIVEKVPTEEKDDLIVVYCRSGGRSGRALEALEKAGYTNAYNFGGIIDWTGEIVVPADEESSR
jgi:rhodanese-related sulfurtransferase